MDIGSALLIVIPILIGFLTYYFQPFKRYGFPSSADFVVTIAMACVLLGIIGTMIVAPTLEQEAANEPCGSNTPEGQCYRLPQLVCRNMWDKYQSECTKEIKKDLGDRVTALIGPAVKKCIQKRFDKSLYYTRKNANASPCFEHFQALKK